MNSSLVIHQWIFQTVSLLPDEELSRWLMGRGAGPCWMAAWLLSLARRISRGANRKAPNLGCTPRWVFPKSRGNGWTWTPGSFKPFKINLFNSVTSEKNLKEEERIPRNNTDQRKYDLYFLLTALMASFTGSHRPDQQNKVLCNVRFCDLTFGSVWSSSGEAKPTNKTGKYSHVSSKETEQKERKYQTSIRQRCKHISKVMIMLLCNSWLHKLAAQSQTCQLRETTICWCCVSVCPWSRQL